jgi:uncharacterized protein YbjT (DUF2867 family)
VDAGYAVRVLVRGSARRLSGRSWSDDVEIAVGDVLQPDTLPAALEEVDVAFYLIHSMRAGEDFHERDRRAADNFARAAAEAGVGRIIYLGGLGDPAGELSRHLRSRQEVGATLRAHDTPVTEFRAAVVVGSGSVSFEMMRHLTERLPVLISPQWVYTRIQPIGIEDLLRYLVRAPKVPESAGQIVEIGGADVTTYADMMRGYAEERGLTRRLVPVPVLTPRLSSYWVHLVTPIPSNIAQPLIKGLRNEVIVRDDAAQRLFPDVDPLPYRSALRRALRNLRQGRVETIWSDAQASSREELPDEFVIQEQGMFIEKRERTVQAPAGNTFRAFASLGGSTGWPPYDWLWEIRGFLDRLVGGVGLRRGRRHPETLRSGDALDFWRVEKIDPPHHLLLRAEMKLPGEAWLRYRAEPAGEHTTRLEQTAFFAPRGLLGLIYWYVLIPFHTLIFPALLDDVAQRAQRQNRA